MPRNVSNSTEELKRLLRQIEEIDPQEKQALSAVPALNVQQHAGLQSRGKQTELWGALGVAILIVVAARVGAILALKLSAISIVAVRDGVSDTKSTTVPSAGRNASKSQPKPAVVQTRDVDAPDYRGALRAIRRSRHRSRRKPRR